MHTNKPLSWTNPKNLSGRPLFVKKKKKRKTQITIRALRIELTKDRTFFYLSCMPYFLLRVKIVCNIKL